VQRDFGASLRSLNGESSLSSSRSAAVWHGLLLKATFVARGRAAFDELVLFVRANVQVPFFVHVPLLVLCQRSAMVLTRVYDFISAQAVA